MHRSSSCVSILLMSPLTKSLSADLSQVLCLDLGLLGYSVHVSPSPYGSGAQRRTLGPFRLTLFIRLEKSKIACMLDAEHSSLHTVI